jgi:predicted DNA-binding antitoxin AbrB/MazE fold protein
MSQITSAIFDGGVFRPESPVSLPPGTRVTLVVEPMEAVDDRAAALAELDAICEEVAVVSTEKHLTRDQLHERR